MSFVCVVFTYSTGSEGGVLCRDSSCGGSENVDGLHRCRCDLFDAEVEVCREAVDAVGNEECVSQNCVCERSRNRNRNVCNCGWAS